MKHPIEISELAGIRYLHFGTSWIQGAMRVQRPNHLELAYTREMMSGLLVHGWRNWPAHVLLVGLGSASMLRFIHHYLPHSLIQVVEIDPRVAACARQFFDLPQEDERFQLHFADAVKWLPQQKSIFDLIVVDGFDARARAGKLDSQAFYRACQSHLSERGIAAINLLGSPRAQAASVRRIRAVFGARIMEFPSCDSGNVITLAACGDTMRIHISELRARAQILKEKFELNLLPTVTRLERYGDLQNAHFVL